MALEEALIPVLAGLGFLYGYTQEKELLLRFVFLFAGLGLIVFGFFNDYVLVNSTTLTTTYLNGTVNATTTYFYAPSSYLTPFGIATGILFTFMIGYFAWLLIKKVKL